MWWILCRDAERNAALFLMMIGRMNLNRTRLIPNTSNSIIKQNFNLRYIRTFLYEIVGLFPNLTHVHIYTIKKIVCTNIKVALNNKKSTANFSLHFIKSKFLFYFFHALIIVDLTFLRAKNRESTSQVRAHQLTMRD